MSTESSISFTSVRLRIIKYEGVQNIIGTSHKTIDIVLRTQKYENV